jgi:FAD:protein FMN transferase
VTAAPVPTLAPVPAIVHALAPAPEPVTRERATVAATAPMMGGRVSVHLFDAVDPAGLEPAAGRVLRRLAAWAARLTRFTETSELSRLNAAPGALVPVGPTLTAALDWARSAEGQTGGLVDAALLDARMAAETGTRPGGPLPASSRWSLDRHARGAVVRREPGLRFDLDGVAKGWLADRALAIAPGRSALVDGDGDIAVRVAPGDDWTIGVADPRSSDGQLAVIRLAAEDGTTHHWGVATSGTTVHRWSRGGVAAHHLIDPRTLRPAETDVVQATVVAATAREAEAYAKVAVILGSDGAFAALDRPGVEGLLLLTERGDVRATPGLLRWLA